MKKLTTEEFIEKARKIHGDKYDYSKVVYTDSHTKVCIICPEHGEFWQTPNSHLCKQKCPKCSGCISYNTESFIQKAKEVHGDRYDYSKTKYVNNHTKICIICPEHGEFWQIPANHLFGQGCFKCYHESRIDVLKYTNNDIIKKFRDKHGDKYDYSKVVYRGITTPVTIICPEHGEFQQIPSSHVNGCGCPRCGQIKSGLNKRLTTEEFIEKARKIHRDKYDYSKVVYTDYETEVTIVCREHGEFQQTPDSHLQGKGCQSCSIRHSNYEEIIVNFVKEHINTPIVVNSRKIIPPLELDVFIPEFKLAIEFNGIRWHTEEFGKDKFYHLNKLEKCNELGINLIQIFEDEIVLHEDVVISKLSHIFGFDNNKPKIYGRNTKILEIPNKIAKEFLQKYHIQGFVSSTVYLGAYYNNILVGVMSFKKYGNVGWELNRFATDYNYTCPGIGGKLLSYFEKNYHPKEIKSFADRRWTLNENNNLYTKLGFTLDKTIPPDYKYVKNNQMERIHKFNLRKNILIKKYKINKNLTENEMTQRLGYFRIWDCGLFKYVKKYE